MTIFILKKTKDWGETLEKCEDLEQYELESYLNQLVKDSEITWWNFWSDSEISDFDYWDIYLDYDDHDD